MLPTCTWTVLMGQVLTLGVDMMNLLFSFVCCTSSQGRFKRSQGKDILDLCPRYFAEILQVLKLKTQTKAASRARTGC